MGGNIVLTDPLEITPSAKIINNYAWQIANDGITVQLNYYDVTGTKIVMQETFYITGDDFTPLKNAVITAGVVGQKYMDVIEKAIRTKILALKNWSGTVP